MKTIVWLHTIPSDHAEFNEIIPQLPRNNFNNILFSPPKQRTSFEDLFTLLNRSVLSAQKDQVSFVAYSWGAYLALTYLSLNPDHVERIFLINPLFHSARSQSKIWHKIQTLPLIGPAVLWPGAMARSQKFLKKIFFPERIPKDKEQKLKSYLRSPSVWQGVSHYLGMVHEFPLSEDLKSFPVPIHALFGNEDQVIPYTSQLSYLQNLVKFSYTLVNQAGHALPWTHAPLIAKEISRFI